MDMSKLVGRNFGKLRKAKGFTQERFSEASGFTQQYISGLERGRRNPTIVTLFELASALGVRSAPAAPCKALAAIRTSIVGDSAHATENTPNRPTPSANRACRLMADLRGEE